MNANYTIFSFKSLQDIATRHRNAAVDYSTDDFILERLRSLALFLDENGLTTRKLTDEKNRICEDFILSSSDLTKFGHKVFKKGHNGWWRNHLQRPPNDISAMERALKKIRAEQSGNKTT